MSTGLQVAGLASNFDWKSFVDQIMSVEHAPADRLTAEKGVNTQKVNLLSALGSKLAALQSSAAALKTDTTFGRRSATSSTTGSTWSATAGANTALGAYTIAVTQLATSATLKGAGNVGAALNPAANDVSGVTLANMPTSQAVSAGTFSVNGKQVTVALTDSLQDVFAAISSATGGDVTAQYDHTTDKITLTAASGRVMLGAANDTSNFLRALKLGNNGTGTVASAAELGSLKLSATIANANLATPITAVDADGAGSFSVNGVAIAYNVNTDSLSSVITRINQSSAGVTARYDTQQDRLVITNENTGDLGIAAIESAGGLLGALGLTSGTTFARGTNAEFTLNGGDVTSSASNTLDATALGIDGLSITVNSLTTQTISVAPDTSAMRAKIDAFIKDYNEVQQFIDTNTRVATDAKGKVTAAALSSNREVQEWGRSLRTLAFNTVSGATGSVSRLNDLGIDFKKGTSELEVTDEAKLTSALTTSTDAVASFFSLSTTGFGAKFDTYLEKLSHDSDDQRERLNKTNSSLDEQIAAIERRLEQQRAVMEAAFIQMETAQSKLKQQQTAISGMFASTSST